ncbi:MAG: hypothetical protein A2493_02540 [Candidatus Magasanikbacteria bacterium RIFOXYC12_FULL_33_11]|uniref:DUF5063 domain-containing protein n=1 Tax=Candidatus Magasanikbacteria bacterium RIFOXYC12_FULL_33_11 TaxID=1798701 RepID=A0A1F6NPK0_9BACT|nr:MAG: hypothetical protein A2493_02540 [Candidatus Magasanikbacteria bacterium RIFOXYC12_FULL_33_11]
MTREDFKVSFYESECELLGEITMAVLYLTSTEGQVDEQAVRDMSTCVKNTVNIIVGQMSAYLQELAGMDEKIDEDGVYVLPLLDATELFLMRDSIEDLRIFNPDFFAEEEIIQLRCFDNLIDRADLHMQDVRDARLNLGERTGHPERRWWSPKY